MRLAPLILLSSCWETSYTARSSQPAVVPAGGRAVVGFAAPDFELPDQDGAAHRLSDLRGKVVVLEWTNPECPFVQRHYDARTMHRAREALPADRAVWLAVDSTHFHGPDDARTWRTERAISWPILQDPSGRVGHLYGARTTPHLFVVDAQGVLRYAGAVDDDPHGEKDRPTVHPLLVAHALLAGEPPPDARTDPYGCSVKYAE